MLRSWMMLSCLALIVMISSITCADEVGDLIDQLQSADMFLRCYAAEQLAQLKDDRAVEPLLKLMIYPMPSNAEATSLASKKAAPGSPLAKVNEAKLAVAGGNKHAPPTQAASLAELKQHVAALKGRSLIGQKDAVQALAQMRDSRAVPLLLKMLEEDRFKNGLKSDVIEALGEIGDPEAYDTIIVFLKEGSLFTRRSAIAALGKLGDPRAVEPLYQTIINDMAVRKDAAEALASIGGYQAVLYLNKAAASDDTFVSKPARESLDQLGPKHGLEPLLNLLADSDPQAKDLAVKALSQLNDPVIQNELQAVTETPADQDHQVVSRTDGDAVSDETKVKVAAINALSQLRSVKTVKPLLHQLTDSTNDPLVRRAAGKALAQYQNRALLETFESDLNSPHRKQQTAALESLAYLGTDEAIELIEPSLDMPALQEEGYKALSMTQNPNALRYLYKALSLPAMRRVAINGILEINDPASAVVLAKSLEAEGMRSEDRLAILNYLAESEYPEIFPYFKNQVADPFIGPQVVDVLIQRDRIEMVESLVFAVACGWDDQTRQKALDKLVQMARPSTMGWITRTILEGAAREDLATLVMFRHGALNNELSNAMELFADLQYVDEIAALLAVPQARKESAAILKKYNWQPTDEDQKIHFYIATQNWTACKQIGRPVMPYLLEELKCSGSGQLASVLAQMHCVDAKPILLKKVNNWVISREQLAVLKNEFFWRPVTLEDKVNVAASEGDIPQLLVLWEQDANVHRIFVQKLADSDDASVGHLVQLCIRLGKDEMISPMIGRFSGIKDELQAIHVASLFLGSGQSRLDQAGRVWADGRGYPVDERSMRRGGLWGQ